MLWEKEGVSSESTDSVVYLPQFDANRARTNLPDLLIAEEEHKQLSTGVTPDQSTIECSWQLSAKGDGTETRDCSIASCVNLACRPETAVQQVGQAGQKASGREWLDESGRAVALGHITTLQVTDMPVGFRLSQLPLAELQSLETLSLLFPKGEELFKEIDGQTAAAAAKSLAQKLVRLRLCLDSAFQLLCSDHYLVLLEDVGHIILEVEATEAVTETKILINLLTLLAIKKLNFCHCNLTVGFVTTCEPEARKARLNLIASELAAMLGSIQTTGKIVRTPRVSALWVTLDAQVSEDFYTKLNGLAAFDVMVESPNRPMSFFNLKQVKSIFSAVQLVRAPEYYQSALHGSFQVFFAPPSPEFAAEENETEETFLTRLDRDLVKFQSLLEYCLDEWPKRRLLIHNAHTLFDQAYLDKLFKEYCEDKEKEVTAKKYLSLYEFTQDLRATGQEHFDLALAPEYFIECRPTPSETEQAEPEPAKGPATSYQQLLITNLKDLAHPLYLFLILHPEQTTHRLCTATIMGC